MDHLFNKFSIHDVFRTLEQRAHEEVSGMAANYLLKVSMDDVIDYLVGKYVPVALSIETDKVEIAVNEERMEEFQDFGRIVERKVNYYEFAVPFSGEKDLFGIQPSQSTLCPPLGKIHANELRTAYYARGSEDAQAVRQAVERNLSEITQYAERLRHDIEQWKPGFQNQIKQLVSSRREKLLKDANLTAAIGFPIRRRDNVPVTYTVPVTQKRIVAKPQADLQPFSPEPALDANTYDEILRVLSDMALVIERNPSSFEGKDEEQLRDHFLIPLNSQFKGSATGETFNHSGKTDILIRVDGRNIFIAECKFWKGAKSLVAAIDQLLGYLCWRDTKAALLVFNRQKDTSAVLTQIPNVVASHKNFKRRLDLKIETAFRFVLHSNQDKNREIIMSVLVFDMPTSSSGIQSA